MTTIELPLDNTLEVDAEMPVLSEALPFPRPRHQVLWFLPTMLIGGVSWMGGGAKGLNDVAMVLFTIACLVGTLWELRHFRRNIGTGGLVIFLGAAVWFSHDYLTHWFGGNYGHSDDVAKYIVSHEIIGKGVFLVGLFMECAVIGLQFSWGKKLSRAIASVPEPADRGFFILVLVVFAVGLIPYMFFVEDSFLTAIYRDMVAMRSGHIANWTVARTGNLNYSWGAYVLRLNDVGTVGGVLAACYAAIVAQNRVVKIICWGIWFFWTALAFGGGSRGPLVAMVMPVIGIIVLKNWIFRNKVAARPLIQAAVLGFILLFCVQFQGTYRNTEVDERRFNGVDITQSQGNMMFTEPLLAYDLVPSAIPHSGDVFVGAQFVRPMPEIVFRFAVGWIPRALWRTKPNSLGDWLGLHDFAFSAFYNQLVTGGSASNDEFGEGTGSGGTVTTSIVGMGYVPYGIPGVIQYGLLFGWLNIVAERALRYSNGRIMALLFGLGLTTYMFRSYRDLTPHNVYPLLIGMLVISIFTKFLASGSTNQSS